jgi:aspartate/methionine/tyrosine aminotransferase
MAITQLSCRAHLIPRTVTMHPDVDRIAQALKNGKLKALIITNPCNPTGTLIKQDDLQQIAKLCDTYGCALILDNTYEDFIFDERPKPEPIYGPNVFNVFSFSKNYGMSGWRMGYLVFHERFTDSLMKVQDTIVICPSQLSQEAALGALEAGTGWIEDRVKTLYDNRSIVKSALQHGGLENIRGGEGGIFVFAQFPHAKDKIADDWQVTETLLGDYGIAVIPGKSCGMPGWIRVSFANLSKEKCIQAAERLEKGLSGLNKLKC